MNQEKEALAGIILSPHEQRCTKNKEFQEMMQWYHSAVLTRDNVREACCHGFFSTQELVYIFKVAVVQQLSMDPERDVGGVQYQEGSMSLKSMEGDPRYQLWVGTFSKMIEQSEQLALDRERQKKGPLIVNSPNKDQLYALFQEAMGIKKSVHQALMKACQVWSLSLSLSLPSFFVYLKRGREAISVQEAKEMLFRVQYLAKRNTCKHNYM